MAKAKLSPKDIARIAGNLADASLGAVDVSLRITQTEFKRRWAEVQAAMKARDYDLVYACGSDLDRSDAAWLAGVYDPTSERYGVLLPADGPPVVLAGADGVRLSAESCRRSGADFAVLREFRSASREFRGGKTERFADVLVRSAIPRRPLVAILSGGESLPLSQYTMLVEAFGVDHVTFDGQLLARIKYEKSLKELRVMAQANKVADAAMRAMLAVTAPGVRESQVAGAADFVMKALGAHSSGCPTLVTSGDRGYAGIGPATDKVIESGDVVSLGVCPTWHGYHGCVGRTVRAGKDFSKEQRAFVEAAEGLYRTVWAATEKAAAKGLPINTIDAAGRTFLAGTPLEDLKGKPRALREACSFIHNTGCSACQEGFGAVTGWVHAALGKRLSLAIECGLMGFDKPGRPLFAVPYALLGDAFWKDGKKVGVYTRTPLDAQGLVGNEKPVPKKDVHPYHAEL